MRSADSYFFAGKLTWRTIISIPAWILLGLIAGFVASKIVNRTGEGLILDIVIGIVGAVVGGRLFNQFGMAGDGIKHLQFTIAVTDAVVLLFLYHLVIRRKG
jgi:uncharacterized membrane protein YeaQ/YmgE (transglycosylase-associated protein family)